MAVHDYIVFDNVTGTAKPNTTHSRKETISLNQAILAASHDKLAIAMIEDISSIGIAGTLIADDLSFAIASIKYVVLDNCARHNVSIFRLIRPDLDCLPSVCPFPRNILETVITNDISNRNSVFEYLVTHMQVYATRSDVGKSAIGNAVLSGAWRKTYCRSFTSTILEHTIHDPTMIGSP